MTSRRCRGNHRVDAPLYIKQREPAGAQKKNSCQFILTVPLFNVGEETTACFLSQNYRVETSCPLFRWSLGFAQVQTIHQRNSRHAGRGRILFLVPQAATTCQSTRIAPEAQIRS